VARKPASSRAGGSLDASTRICVIYGSEPMLKQQHLQQLRDALTEAHGEIQTFDFDGESAALSDVLDEVRSYGLMQQYKLVVVDNADQFVSSHREALMRYAQSPVDHATLCFRSGKWNSGNLDKLIQKCGAIVKCEPLGDADAAAWLVERATTEYQRKLDRAVAMQLVQRLGSDLLRLDSELAKLAVLAEPGKPIPATLVEQLVGRGGDEDAWKVQEDLLAALLAKRGQGPSPIQVVRDMIDVYNQPKELVTYFVADLMRKLFTASALRRQGVPEAGIAKALKLWGPRTALFMTVVARTDTAQLGRLYDRILRYDGRSKSGLGDAVLNLECFCAELADVLR
jgi:DNA polymerase-3 subunit delta